MNIVHVMSLIMWCVVIKCGRGALYSVYDIIHIVGVMSKYKGCYIIERVGVMNTFRGCDVIYSGYDVIIYSG